MSGDNTLHEPVAREVLECVDDGMRVVARPGNERLGWAGLGEETKRLHHGSLGARHAVKNTSEDELEKLTFLCGCGRELVGAMNGFGRAPRPSESPANREREMVARFCDARDLSI